MPKSRAPDSPTTSIMQSEYLSIAKCQIDGHEQFKVISFNPLILSGTEATIWSAGGMHTFPDHSGETLFISSSNALDTQNLLIQATLGSGLQAPLAGFINLEDALLNGQVKTEVGGGVYRSTQDVFVFGDVTNLGDIYVYTDSPVVDGVPTDPTTIQAKIIAGHNRAQTGWTDVPNNKRAFEVQLDYYATALDDKVKIHKPIEFQQWVRPPGGSFQLVIRTPMDVAQVSHVPIPLPYPSPGLSDTLVEFRVCNTSDSDIQVAVFATFLNIREEFLDFNETTPSQGIDP